jgi:hypothetical protein
MCLASHTAKSFNLNSHRYLRMMAIRGATHAVCQYGVNDLNLALTPTFSSVGTDPVTAWRLMADRGMKVYQTTITPFTTSTDSFSTTTNQTIASGVRSSTVRILIND